MIEITNFRQGAVLNHNHGTETEKALTVTIQGVSSSGYPVYVNGVKADMDGQRFEAEVDLTEKINNIKASVTTPYGTFSQDISKGKKIFPISYKRLCSRRNTPVFPLF